MSILVIEAFQADDPDTPASPSFDDRSTALSFGSRRLLDEAGLWSALEAQVTPIENIHVSDRGHFGSAKLSHHEQQVDALGYVVENRNLGQVLNKSLLTTPSIDFLCPATITEIKPNADGMALTVDVKGTTEKQQQSIQSGLLVLADGGRSPICNQLGINIDKQDYQQKAIISNIAFEKPHNFVAYERFTDTGPMAILPLPVLLGENRGALVWTVNEEDAEPLMNQNDTELLAQLQDRFGYRLGKLIRIGKRACYPLSLSIASEQVRPGLVLLGNVAHTLHPVAGQGFNLALRDADSLAEVLTSAHARQELPGSMAVLQRFLEAQIRDQSRTIDFSHYMTGLFSNNRKPLVWARKFGLAFYKVTDRYG